MGLLLPVIVAVVAICVAAGCGGAGKEHVAATTAASHPACSQTVERNTARCTRSATSGFLCSSYSPLERPKDCLTRAQQAAQARERRAADAAAAAKSVKVAHKSTSSDAASPLGWKRIYDTEYAVCEGITIAEIRRDYGFDTDGMTPEEVILKMEQESYSPQFVTPAYEACVDAYSKQPPRRNP